MFRRHPWHQANKEVFEANLFILFFAFVFLQFVSEYVMKWNTEKECHYQNCPYKTNYRDRHRHIVNSLLYLRCITNNTSKFWTKYVMNAPKIKYTWWYYVKPHEFAWLNSIIQIKTRTCIQLQQELNAIKPCAHKQADNWFRIQVRHLLDIVSVFQD